MIIKKLISLVLSVVMIIMTVNAAASDEQIEAADSSLLLLNSLGIVSYTEYDNTEVTRAEFTDMVVRAMGYLGREMSVFNGEAYFTDIDTDDDYFEAIGTAAVLGIVSGYDNGRFYPYGAMKTEFAKGIAIKALTTGFYEQMKDYYYSEISSGIEGNENLDRKNAVRIVMNMLNSNVLKHYDVDNVVISDSTMLEDVFSVYKTKGVLNGNDVVSLYGTSVAMKDNVIIGNTQVHTEDISVYNYIGYEIEGYIKDVNDEKELLCFAPTSRNKIVHIEAEDIYNTTTIRQIDYYTGTKDKAIDISVADVIYNNELLLTYDASDLQPAYGNVTVIDNNQDSISDVVIVKAYTNCVVDSASPIAKKLYFKYGQSELDTREEKLLIFDADGEETPYLSLEEYDVLAVYRNKTVGGDIITFAEVSEKEPVTGKIQGLFTRDGKTVVNIDDIEYEMDAGYMTYSALSPKEAPKPEIGIESTFYLSNDGVICAISRNASDGTHYGYMTKLKYDSDEDILYLTIYTEAGKLETFSVFEKMRYNGIKEDVSAIYGYVQNDTTGALKNQTYNKFEPQLVKYEIRGGELKGFEVSTFNRADEFNRVAMADYVSRRNVNILHSDVDRGTKYFWDENTKIMRVADFTGEDFQQDDIEYLTADSILGDTHYWMTFYNVDDNTNYVENIVIVSAAISDWSSGRQKNFVITSIYEELNHDDIPAHTIEGYDENGVKQKYYMKSDKNYVTISNLKEGDIVGLFADSNNEVIGLRKIFTTTPKSNDTMTGTENVKGHVAYAGSYTKQSLLTDGDFTGDDYSGYFSIYGKTIAKIGKQVVVKSYAKDTSGNPTSTETVSPLTTEHNAPVIIVDYTGRGVAVTKGTTSDIRSNGAEVLAITKQYYPNVIYVIYR